MDKHEHDPNQVVEIEHVLFIFKELIKVKKV